uniref:Uncharacterized protein n=1 Tax=Rhizophora mucronata TaxID=61149 RepID=A0A2P2P5E7_RHIMU
MVSSSESLGDTAKNPRN